MPVISELAELVEFMRATGVLRIVTPELTVELGPQPVQIPEASAPRPMPLELNPRVEAGLRRLPPGYRDPRLWNLGDSA